MKKYLGLVAVLSFSALGCEPAAPTPSNTAAPPAVTSPADTNMPADAATTTPADATPAADLTAPPADPAK